MKLALLHVVTACAVACTPCDRAGVFKACFGAADASECASVIDCVEGEHCLPCGICVAVDECDNLAGSCASNADCTGNFICDGSCGCVAP